MILVGRNYEPDAVYIGRGSPLGNPFVLGQHGDRDEVCDQYEEWIEKKIQEQDPRVIGELQRLLRLQKENGGHLILGCFCCHSTDQKQQRCHGHTVKRILESGRIHPWSRE